MSSFNKMSEFSELKSTDDIGIEIQKTASEDPIVTSPEAVVIPVKNEEFDEDAPGYFSWNPIDWYNELKREILGFNFTMTEKKRVLLRAILGEGLCTFLFMFTVEATGVNNGRQENPENLVLAAISTAFCSIALIYSFADVSGAHFNPAVTVATIVTGKVSLRKGLAFIAIQLFASVMATLFLMVVFPPSAGAGLKSIAHAVVVDIDSSAQLVNAFFMELILTFVLVYVIFATAFDTVDTSNSVKVEAGKKSKDSEAGKNLTIYTTSGNTKAGFAPVAIGFTLGFLGLIGGTVSGGAYNPARVFGPALITGHWNNHWVYWLGDCIGAGLAGWAQHFFAHEAVQHSASSGTKAGTKKN
ncbi:hypothetical protein HDV05_001155 [Chytridiales sp. JEL 0842]|nr:hypothetical protein HDV05_001155 [Chytridiales sp. JEL 0842]